MAAVVLASALPASAEAVKCKGDDAFSYNILVRAEGGRSHAENGLPREDYVTSFKLDYFWAGVRLAYKCGKRFESVELVGRGSADYTTGTAHFEDSSNVYDTAGQGSPCSWTLDLTPEARLSLFAKDSTGRRKSRRRWRFEQRGGVGNHEDPLYREIFANVVTEHHTNACPDRSFHFAGGINPPTQVRRGLEIFAQGWPEGALDLNARARGAPPRLFRKLFAGKDAFVTDSWQVQATDPITGFVETERGSFEVRYDRRGR